MILMYHKVDLWPRTMWWVDVATFYRQMVALKGHRVVFLDDYDPGDPQNVTITFDGVYRNVLVFAAPILKKFQYPFELFVSSDLIGKQNDFDVGEPPTPFASFDDLRELVNCGGRLQWHTRSHPMLEHHADQANWEDVRKELTIPEKVKELDSNGFKWFAYPYGAFSEDVYDEVKKQFSGAVSCHQGNDHDTHRLNRMTITNHTSLDDKTICVMVVSHNYGEFLSEAIESVLQQTYLPNSILLVDDASSDITESVCRKYVSLRPDLISYIRNEQRLGIVGTFRRAIDVTESDYVCFLGADNRLATNYIELCKAEMDAAKEGSLAVVYTDFLLFGPNAQDEYLKHPAGRRGRVINDMYYEVVFPDFRRGALLEGSFVHGSAMYRRDVYEKVGGYVEQQGGRPEDANLFRKMFKAGYDGRKVVGTWLEYRQHSEEQANAISRTKGELEFYRVYAKRLEAKIKMMEAAFGVLSPLVRLMSRAEKACFELALRIIRTWRRVV